jgi:hypothetical protein
MLLCDFFNFFFYSFRADLMRKSELEVPKDNNAADVPFRGEVYFDPDLLLLEGRYSDELCAHRARREWMSVFSANFLLEPEHDFMMSVGGEVDDGGYALRCSFVSACGRYAFWRLTHGQAQDAQALLERAHMPRPNKAASEVDVVESDDYSQMPPSDELRTGLRDLWLVNKRIARLFAASLMRYSKKLFFLTLSKFKKNNPD